MRILSIQSSVAYGYAGNTAAVFPLQRLGHEVVAVNTVHFSNHTGYGSFRGMVHDPAAVADVIDGVADRGALAATDVVLTGYLGSPGIADVVLATVARVKAANPNARYCCDPVMGDTGKGMYVADGIPELIRDRVVPAADILVPNAFELAYLAGTGGDPATATPADITTDEALLAAVETVRARGPRTVLVTSIEDGGGVRPVPGGAFGPGDTGELFGVTRSTPHDPAAPSPDASASVSMVAVSDEGAWKVSTPRLPLLVNGGGDVTTAVFLAHLTTDGIEAALARTASTLHGILTATLARIEAPGPRADHNPEIAIIAAQQSIAAPACEFDVVRLR